MMLLQKNLKILCKRSRRFLVLVSSVKAATVESHNVVTGVINAGGNKRVLGCKLAAWYRSEKSRNVKALIRSTLESLRESSQNTAKVPTSVNVPLASLETGQLQTAFRVD